MNSETCICFPVYAGKMAKSFSACVTIGTNPKKNVSGR